MNFDQILKIFNYAKEKYKKEREREREFVREKKTIENSVIELENSNEKLLFKSDSLSMSTDIRRTKFNEPEKLS